MIRKRSKSVFIACIILLLTVYLSGCMRYLTQDRGKVLLDGVDISQSLEVAEMYLNEKEGGMGSSLAIWAIRDQHFTPEQAEEVSGLYFQYINGLKKKFDIWHLTWAIANIFRHGDGEVQKVLQEAYADATKRAKEVSNIADKMMNGEKMYLGDAHGGGRAFAKKHLVVPGNKKYLQSFDEYKEKRLKKKSGEKTN